MIRFSYTLNQLAGFCGADFVGVSGQEYVQELLVDSRKATSSTKHLFIAIKGRNHNGHSFIAELYSKGLRNFLISEPKELQLSIRGSTFYFGLRRAL